MKLKYYLNVFLTSIFKNCFRLIRIKYRNGEDDGTLLRETRFVCPLDMTNCPPCYHHGNKLTHLISKSPENYGKCTFNGTVLTIPQRQSLDDEMREGYYIVAKETISAEKKNTFILATLEDIEYKRHP